MNSGAIARLFKHKAAVLCEGRRKGLVFSGTLGRVRTEAGGANAASSTDSRTFCPVKKTSKAAEVGIFPNFSAAFEVAMPGLPVILFQIINAS